MGDMGMFSGLVYCADCGGRLYFCRSVKWEHTDEYYTCSSYEKLSADELGLREMLSTDGVTKARKAALERLRSRYPGSGLHLWRDVYHSLKDISDI